MGELVEVHGSLQLQQGHVISDESLASPVGVLRVDPWTPLRDGSISLVLSGLVHFVDEFPESIKLMEELLKWSIKGRVYLQSESQMDH